MPYSFFRRRQIGSEVESRSLKLLCWIDEMVDRPPRLKKKPAMRLNLLASRSLFSSYHIPLYSSHRVWVTVSATDVIDK